MDSLGILYWVSWIAALALLLPLIRELRGRKVDDHPHCGRCGYDLFGLPEGRQICPECGGFIGAPEKIRHGRRIRMLGRIAVAAFLVLAMSGLNFYVDRVRTQRRELPGRFMRAIFRGDVAQVDLILKAHPEFANGIPGSSGDLPIYVATSHGQLGVLRRLLVEKVNVNAPGEYQRTPLHIAAEHDLGPAVSMLLAKGAVIESRDQFKRTPLHYAAQGMGTSLQLLLTAGADVTARDDLNRTPLHWACERSRDPKRLLDAGADVNAVDGAGYTPLHYVVRWSEQIGETLVARGADLAAKNTIGLTPGQLADQQGFQGWAVNMWWARILAADKSRRLADIPPLLARDPGWKLHNGMGGTLLHKAIAANRADLAHMLLDAGADPNVKSAYDETPLYLAIMCAKGDPKMIEMLELLLEHKADIDAPSRDGNTPLHFAVLINDRTAVALLYQRGAKDDILNLKKQTPLDVARDTHRGSQIIQLLQSPRPPAAGN